MGHVGRAWLGISDHPSPEGTEKAGAPACPAHSRPIRVYGGLAQPEAPSLLESTGFAPGYRTNLAQGLFAAQSFVRKVDPRQVRGCPRTPGWKQVRATGKGAWGLRLDPEEEARGGG